MTVRIRVTTDAKALTPLDRNQIFNREFQGFLATASRATDSTGRVRHRRLERQVRGVELLSAREKLMAGLPNFATYFGRDMMMTALMMRADVGADHVRARDRQRAAEAGAPTAK